MSPAPGEVQGFYDLPLLVPGTAIPSYGIALQPVQVPPAAGRSFTEIPTYQKPYVLVRIFAKTFDGFHLPVESHTIRDGQAELRWFAPGVVRVTLEVVPGWILAVNYLILLG